MPPYMTTRCRATAAAVHLLLLRTTASVPIIAALATVALLYLHMDAACSHHVLPFTVLC